MRTEKIHCIIVDDDEVSRTLLKHFINKTEFLFLAHICRDALEAHQVIQRDPNIDLIFLDVEMPQMSGMEFLEMSGVEDKFVILTTVKTQYAVEAFEREVDDYIVKPIQYPRFLKAVDKIRKRRDSEEQSITQEANNFLFVRSNGKVFRLAPADIVMVEALSDYIIVHTDKQKLIVHSTMKKITERLSAFSIFVRVHRSFIVNIGYIENYRDTEITMKNKAIVPVGRLFRPEFLARISIL